MEQLRFTASHLRFRSSVCFLVRSRAAGVCSSGVRGVPIVDCAPAGACGCHLKEVSLAYLLKGDSRKNRSREFDLKFKSGRNPDFQLRLPLPVLKPELHARLCSPPRIEQGDKGRTAECQCSQCCQCRCRFVFVLGARVESLLLAN